MIIFDVQCKTFIQNFIINTFFLLVVLEEKNLNKNEASLYFLIRVYVFSLDMTRFSYSNKRN
jgi:hypothetical protein